MRRTSKPRIVSLIASATEIVCALGFERSLVGRSHECDFPPAVRRLPILTRPKFDVGGSSRDIDHGVKAALRSALSVYDVDAAKLSRLNPDVIVTQSQCDVCAVSLKDVERAVCGASSARIVSLEPNSLADIWSDIRKMARALGAGERGGRVVSGLKGRIAAVARKAADLKPKPRVACVEWIDPLMAAGNWMPELVRLAGGINLFGEAGRHSPWMTWSALKENDPDVILVIPCGFDLARTRAEMRTLKKKSGWAKLKAVRRGRVYLADGNQYFNRPGPRIVESLEILAEILHPEDFRFGHEGAGWERLFG